MTLVAGTVLAVILFLADTNDAAKEIKVLERHAYGKGSVHRTLRILVDGKELEDSLELTIGERQYTEEELEQIFEDAITQMEKEMLLENESLDHVDSNLKLMTELEGIPVRIHWEISRYDLMNYAGELMEEKVDALEEGTPVRLKAYLNYTEDESIGVVHEMSIRIYPPSKYGKDALIRMVKREVEKADEKEKHETKVVLPDEIHGQTLVLKNPRNYRSVYVFFSSILICILLVALQKQEEREAKKYRSHQLLLDYPDITDKLALLLGAGITVKNAWQRIALDYERQKELIGERFAYEEMVTAYHEMQTGATEASSYENFAMRCGIKEYRKLATLLTQNMRKGTKGLTELLKAEAELAFEERKAMAKRKGEEAGTKLLIPMFGMLAMVLVIVIVPAFLSMQL